MSKQNNSSPYQPDQNPGWIASNMENSSTPDSSQPSTSNHLPNAFTKQNERKHRDWTQDRINDHHEFMKHWNNRRDPESQDRLLKHLMNSIANHASKKSDNPSDFDDIASDLCEKVITKIFCQWDPNSNNSDPISIQVEKYLNGGFLRGKSIDCLHIQHENSLFRKTKKSIPCVSLNEVPGWEESKSLEDSLRSSSLSSVDALCKNEILNALSQTLAQLDEESKNLLILYYGLETGHPMSYRDIENATGIKRSTAGRKIEKALSACRDYFEANHGPEIDF